MDFLLSLAITVLLIFATYEVLTDVFWKRPKGVKIFVNAVESGEEFERALRLAVHISSKYLSQSEVIVITANNEESMLKYAQEL